ncbi:MAG TPA: sigma-70 family RNA polymerase sigma factor [Candidatus Eremiobacteraceae bacterium]|nr:sigma-70 family RNA polymerase sigma factor [Candidatus Eremiobacteraceae bacterium]
MPNVPNSEETDVPVAAAASKAQESAVRREDDRELVRRAQLGDKDAFELLVARHQGRVFAVAGGILRNREDVEDIAQQVFLKAYFSLKRFDQRSAFSTWLYKITVNECWDLLRKKKVRPLVFESELSEEQAHAYHSTEQKPEFAPDVTEQLATRQQLDQWLDCLEERDRAMLVLKEIQGFTVEEIADSMGLNGNTVKVRLFRARQRIAAKLRRKKAAAL